MSAPVPPPPPAPGAREAGEYGSAPAYGAAPEYGAVPAYGTQAYGSAPAYGAAPAYGTQPYGAQPYGASSYGASSTTNTLAWVSLALGIAALLVGTLASIGAVICGHIARRQIRATGQQGDGLAFGGLVLGYIGIVLSVLLVVFFMVLFAGFGLYSTVPDSI